MTEKEIQKIMSEMGDERIVSELDIGCENLFDQGRARCLYNDGHCTRGAVLTCTMYGAYPADCPIRKGKTEEHDG